MLRNRKVRYLVLASFCFYLIALLNNAVPMFVLCWATVSGLGVAWVLSRWALTGLDAKYQVIRSRIFSGDPLPVTLLLDNSGSLPKSNLLVREQWYNETLKLGDERTSLVAWLGGSEQVGLARTLTAPYRGLYRLRPAEAIGSDPLGIFEVQRPLGEETTILVYPRPLDLPGFHLKPLGEIQTDHPLARRPVEDGLDFRGIREYQPGDDLRRVHWKTTAHAGTLYIREFEENLPAWATVVLDLYRGWQFGAAPESTVEYGVSLAASICRGLLRQGFRMRFLACDEGPIDLLFGEGESRSHLYQVLEPLAVVTGAGNVPLERLLQSHLRSLLGRVTLILITASVAPELAELLVSLCRRGGRVLVMALAPDSFSTPEAGETPPGRNGDQARPITGRRFHPGKRSCPSPGEADETPPPANRGPDLEEAHHAFVGRLRRAGAKVFSLRRGDDPAVSLRL